PTLGHAVGSMDFYSDATGFPNLNGAPVVGGGLAYSCVWQTPSSTTANGFRLSESAFDYTANEGHRYCNAIGAPGGNTNSASWGIVYTAAPNCPEGDGNKKELDMTGYENGGIRFWVKSNVTFNAA